MSARCLVFGMTVWLAGQAAAHAQTFRSNTQKAASLRTTPKLLTPSMYHRGSLHTFETSRYHGIATRNEQLRTLLPQRYMNQQAGPADQLRPSPIKSILKERNLLSVRSPLARSSGSFIGRNDFVKDETGSMRGDYSRIEKQAATTTAPIDPLRPDDGKFEDAIVTRLNARMDEYFERAAEAFRARQYLRSRDYFNLLRDIEPDATRGYLGSMFVSFQKYDYSQASGSLLRAMDIAQKLTDLKMDTAKFYNSREDFKRRVENLNLIAQQNAQVYSPSLILSYCAWLNGDIGTAIDAAAVAEKLMISPSNVPVKKFRELLIKERASMPKAPK